MTMMMMMLRWRVLILHLLATINHGNCKNSCWHISYYLQVWQGAITINIIITIVITTEVLYVCAQMSLNVRTVDTEWGMQSQNYFAHLTDHHRDFVNREQGESLPVQKLSAISWLIVIRNADKFLQVFTITIPAWKNWSIARKASCSGLRNL